MTKTQPREFWIVKYGAMVGNAYTFPPEATRLGESELIHVREVIPGDIVISADEAAEFADLENYILKSNHPQPSGKCCGRGNFGEPHECEKQPSREEKCLRCEHWQATGLGDCCPMCAMVEIEKRDANPPREERAEPPLSPPTTDRGEEKTKPREFWIGWSHSYVMGKYKGATPIISENPVDADSNLIHVREVVSRESPSVGSTKIDWGEKEIYKRALHNIVELMPCFNLAAAQKLAQNAIDFAYAKQEAMNDEAFAALEAERNQESPHASPTADWLGEGKLKFFIEPNHTRAFSVVCRKCEYENEFTDLKMVLVNKDGSQALMLDSNNDEARVTVTASDENEAGKPTGYWKSLYLQKLETADRLRAEVNGKEKRSRALESECALHKQTIRMANESIIELEKENATLRENREFWRLKAMEADGKFAELRERLRKYEEGK